MRGGELLLVLVVASPLMLSGWQAHLVPVPFLVAMDGLSLVGIDFLPCSTIISPHGNIKSLKQLGKLKSLQDIQHMTRRPLEGSMTMAFHTGCSLPSWLLGERCLTAYIAR